MDSIDVVVSNIPPSSGNAPTGGRGPFGDCIVRVISGNVKNVTDYESFVETIVLLGSEPTILTPNDIYHSVVVCVQECADITQLVRSFKARGYVTTRFGSTGNLIFTPNDTLITKKEYVPFVNTNENRGAIIYNMVLGPTMRSDRPSITICTAQFESGGTGSGFRKAQVRWLDTIPQRDEWEIIIFAGDTNICSWQTELNTMLPGDRWLDAWRMMGRADNEITNPKTGDRRDRVWYRTNHRNRCSFYDVAMINDREAAGGGETVVVITDFLIKSDTPTEGS